MPVRLLSAVGSHGTLAFGPLGNLTFCIALDFIAFSALPSPTTVGTGGVCVCVCLSASFSDFPHFVEWHNRNLRIGMN